jgi:alkylhydroperoxidase/carboxymuconolactone decarboxylase family protein YurZ
MPPSLERTLRRIALGDPAVLRDATAHDVDAEAGLMDDRVLASARLGALLASGSPVLVLQQGVSEALLAGMTRDQIASILLAIVPTIGLARAAVMAPRLGLANGYDVEAALE